LSHSSFSFRTINTNIIKAAGAVTYKKPEEDTGKKSDRKKQFGMLDG